MADEQTDYLVSDGAMLIETADRLFADLVDDAAMRRARAGAWLGDAWRAVVEMGLPLALVPEAAGGFGVAATDALALVRLAGRHALPLPLAETMIANQTLAAAGLPLAPRVATLIDAASLGVASGADGWRLGGEVARVADGRHAETLVIVDCDGVWRLDDGWRVASTAVNLAGMARDTLAIEAAAVTRGAAPSLPPLPYLAAVRSLQIAGALERVLEMTVDHVSERSQFGRPLAKFQSVQHELARLGGEVAAAGAAADIAAEAVAAAIEGDTAATTLAIAAARIRVGEAAGAAAAIAQQLHGAIGFTAEHRLHWYTTALWSWRDEGGGQRYWTDLLGRAALAGGGAGFWQFVTAAA